DSLPTTSGVSHGVGVSRDGTRLALVVHGERGSQIVVKSLPNGPVTPITFEGGSSRPVWSSDGRDLYYVGDRNGRSVALRRSADGTGGESVVAEEARGIYEVAVSPDGKWLLYRTDYNSAGRGDILARMLTGDTTPRTLLATQFEESSPAISPDSRF